MNIYGPARHGSAQIINWRITEEAGAIATQICSSGKTIRAAVAGARNHAVGVNKLMLSCFDVLVRPRNSDNP